MKIKFLSLFVALAAVANSSFADAGHDFPPTTKVQAASPADSGQARSAQATDMQVTRSGKTRAEVIQELIEAQKAGLVPTSRSDYPPSEATIARNRARYETDTLKAATAQ